MKTTRQVKRDAAELWRLCRSNGSIDETRARQVADQILASGRSRAPAVLSQFVRLLKLDAVQHSALVVSAAPLDPATRTSVEQSLHERHGARLDVRFAVDPTLIGGMRIVVGSDIYDGSVKGELDALDEAFGRP